MTKLLLALSVVVASVALGGDPHPETAFRALVWAKPGSSWESKLPPGWRVLAQQGELVLLQRESRVTAESLRSLRKVPGIEAVERDYRVDAPERYQTDNRRPAPGSQAPHQSPSPRAKTGGSTQAKDCPLSEVCSDGRAKYWAQDAVDADLMAYKLKQQGIADPVNVAVVDSGFDAAQKGQMTVEGEVRVAAGVEPKEKHPITQYQPDRYSSSPLIGDLTKDESGHGTMVASTIGGQGRLGVAPGVNLTVYRVTKPGDTGSTSSSILDMAIYRACEQGRDPDGITVINVSWGGRLDETGIQPEEKDEVTAKLLAKLAEMGCLVVKAAGNDNFRRDREDDPEDAYLRVAATDPSGELADFSTVGEVQAPGQRIYMLESTTATRKAESDRRCGGDRTSSPRRFANGTSFAAPITAGLAAQVVRVLKHGEHFKALASGDRIRLVNRILRASTLGGNINGLRAVVIAQRWNGSSDELRERALEDDGLPLLRGWATEPPDAVCEEKLKPCDKERTCEALRACFNLGRAQVALCPTEDPLVPANLARTAFKQGNFEFGYHYARVGRGWGADDKTLRTLHRETVQHYLSSKGYKMSYVGHVDKQKQEEAIRDLDPNFVKFALAPYLEDMARNRSPARDHARTLIRGILASPEIRNTLAYGVDPTTKEDRGSGSLMEALDSVLASGRKLLGEHGFSSLIGEFVDDFNETVRKREETYRRLNSSLFATPSSAAAARILGHLMEKEAPGSKVHDALVKAENSLFSELRKYNQHEGNRTMPLVFFEEIYPTRPLFDGLLERHWGDTEARILEGKWTALSPVEAHYALRANIQSKVAVVDRALGVLSSIADGKGWGKRDDPELVERAMVVLHESWKDMPEEEQRRVRAAFLKIAMNAENPHFAARLLLAYWENQAYGVVVLEELLDIVSDKETRAAGREYAAHPLLDREGVAALSQRLATLAMAWKPEDMKHFKYDRSFLEGVGMAWRGLLWAPTGAGGKASLPVASPRYPDRLEETPKRVEVTLESAPTVDTFLTKMFRLAGAGDEASATMVRDGFSFWSGGEKHPEVANLFEEMPASGPWREAALQFTKQSGYGRYEASSKLRDFMSRLDSRERKKAAAQNPAGSPPP